VPCAAKSPGLCLLFLACALGLGACGNGSAGEAGSPHAASTAGSPPQNGEESIEDFGKEAVDSQRQAIVGAEHALLVALSRADYQSACSFFAANVQASLRQLTGARRASCPSVLPKLLSPSAPRSFRSEAAGHITRVRIEGEQAFVVFHAPGAELYFLTMQREGVRWKATTLVPSVLVPTPAGG
jgi:hypothetical protein